MKPVKDMTSIEIEAHIFVLNQTQGIKPFEMIRDINLLEAELRDRKLTKIKK
jgi:hypothetical protein